MFSFLLKKKFCLPWKSVNKIFKKQKKNIFFYILLNQKQQKITYYFIAKTKTKHLKLIKREREGESKMS